MTAYIKCYDKCKYEKDAQKICEVTLDNVKDFIVVLEYSKYASETHCADDCGEYLVVFFENGTHKVYMNSRVDLFYY